MIKQVELSWSWTMFPSFDWHSEWPSIWGKKKDPIELCYNETKKTYWLSKLSCNRPASPQMVRFIWLKIVKCFTSN